MEIPVLEQTIIPLETETSPAKNFKIPYLGYIVAAVLASLAIFPLGFLAYEWLGDDADIYEVSLGILTSLLWIAYFASIIFFPSFTKGKGRNSITTKIFVFPFLAAVSFFLYTVPGNMRDYFNVWSEFFRIIWYGLLVLAPLGAAYTLSDSYDGKCRWLLLLKPHYKQE